MRQILWTFLPARVVQDWQEGRLSLGEAVKKPIEVGNKDSLIIIDNCESLSIHWLGRLEVFISSIKNEIGFSHLGIILITATSLAGNLNVLDHEYPSPDWGTEDLEAMLKYYGIKVEKPIQAYLALLHAQSGGHPLVARALAEKYRRVMELSVAHQQDGTPLYDNVLSEDVAKFLFDGLLQNEDDRNLVMRASVLVFSFGFEELELLSDRISPRINKPVKLIMRDIGRTVFETAPGGLFTTVHIFGQVAKSYVGQSQQQEILRAVADSYFRPKTGVLNIVSACKGIWYYSAAGEIETALLWADHILHVAISNKWKQEHVQFVLRRLFFLQLITWPTTERACVTYAVAMVLLSVLYDRNNQAKEASACIGRLEEFIAYIRRNKLVDDVIIIIIEFQICFIRLLWKAREKDWVAAMQIINNIPEVEDEHHKRSMYGILVLLDGLIQECDVHSIPWRFIVRIIEGTSSEETERIAIIISWFIRIGQQYGDAKRDIDSEFGELPEANNLGEICFICAKAQKSVVRRKESEALRMVNKAHEMLISFVDEPFNAGRYLVVLKADLLYNKDSKDNARKIYERVAKEFRGDFEGFYRAWCSLRLGLMEEDLRAGLRYFTEAKDIFKAEEYLSSYSESLGECAIAEIGVGNKLAGINNFKLILDKYYLEGIQEFARAALITTSILNNICFYDPPLRDDTRGGDDNVIIGLRRGAYADSTVSREGKPIVGKPLAFHALSEVCRKYGYRGEMRETDPEFWTIG